jgi:hypothetical protein
VLWVIMPYRDSADAQQAMGVTSDQ